MAATYAELLLASENPALRNKVRVATVVAAEKVRVEAVNVPNHDLRLAWAKEVFNDSSNGVTAMLWAVLAQNRAFDLAVILGADDATVQTAVDAAVNVFAV